MRIFLVRAANLGSRMVRGANQGLRILVMSLKLYVLSSVKSRGFSLSLPMMFLISYGNSFENAELAQIEKT